VWGSGGIAPPFLTSALNGGEWSASRPCRFTPGERKHGTYWIGGWGPQRRSGRCGEKPYPCRDSNPGRPARSPSLHQSPSQLSTSYNRKRNDILWSGYVLSFPFLGSEFLSVKSSWRPQTLSRTNLSKVQIKWISFPFIPVEQRTI
jgi:hypothetical protein